MRKLYCLEGRYLCRKCGNLGYYSQRLKPSDRFLLQESKKVSQKIKRLGGNIDTDLKPPRMHKKTFQAYKNKAEYLTAKYLLAGIEEIKSYKFSESGFFDTYFEDEAKYIVEKYKHHQKLIPEKTKNIKTYSIK
jgi:hypothetical protein